MKVVFIDRDGVINRFPGDKKYVTRVKDFYFLPRTLLALKSLSDAGFKLFVVSNQAGVGKGVYSQFKLDQINDFMLRHVNRVGARIQRVFYCTHRSDAGCDCRKPRIGSIIKAMQLLKKPLSDARNAFFVGDTKGDIQAGAHAGCKTIFVLSGRENRRSMKAWEVQPDYIAEDLWAATQIIHKYHENSDYSLLRRRRTHQSRRSPV